ncbi:MarP family serine protease [Corynebacterium aquilae]|uniref:MarP family serine protease n=1 Tax=Corynebacterium aquilae TaxID=203263 RepID=UPI00095248FF|nr:MarP family serine protease [Corynebacterium aquilae]
MLTGTIIDVIVIIALLSALAVGWRQGVIAASLSILGVIAGLFGGMLVTERLANSTDNPGLRILLVLGAYILLIAIGHMAGSAIGAALRDRMRFKSSQRIDSLLGAVFQTFATLVVLWLIAGPLASSNITGVNTAVSQSQIMRSVDGHMPKQASQLPNKLAALLSESGLPPLISPFTDHAGTDVPAPAINVEDKELVERLRPSVVHVLGDATQCSRRLSGTGFVVDDSHIITNAHVVAGTNTVRLDTVLGMKNADVVYYNPSEDIAVLFAQDLGLPALQWAPEPAVSGEDTIVMGFPNSGPFEAAPGRVKDKLTVNGPDIYATTRIDREAYTVRGTIRQGNSGGPMVNLEGQVVGVVFGASIDKTDTGFVLTAQEVRDSIGDISGLRDKVDTKTCVNGHGAANATLEKDNPFAR